MHRMNIEATQTLQFVDIRVCLIPMSNIKPEYKHPNRPLRCDITHGKGEETIASSVSFLLNYDTILYDQDQINDKKEGNTVPNPTVSTNASSSVPPKLYRKELADSCLWQTPAAGEPKLM
jgi:hypothetical protein